MSQHTIVLLLGSNLGDKKNNIERALYLIEKKIGLIIGRSKMIETEPVEFISENPFINMAIRCYCPYSPIKLLKIVKEIEVEIGRKIQTKQSENYTDREIDIDIVSFNAILFQSKTLQIPHYKHTNERNFSIELISNIY